MKGPASCPDTRPYAGYVRPPLGAATGILAEPAAASCLWHTGNRALHATEPRFMRRNRREKHPLGRATSGCPEVSPRGIKYPHVRNRAHQEQPVRGVRQAIAGDFFVWLELIRRETGVKWREIAGVVPEEHRRTRCTLVPNYPRGGISVKPDKTRRACRYPYLGQWLSRRGAMALVYWMIDLLEGWVPFITIGMEG